VGDVTVVAFAALAFIGLALVGWGALRGARLPLVIGGSLLLALACAWVVGLPGAVLGAIPLAFARRKRARSR
jgi:homoserine acetyltransferase